MKKEREKKGGREKLTKKKKNEKGKSQKKRGREEVKEKKKKNRWEWSLLLLQNPMDAYEATGGDCLLEDPELVPRKCFQNHGSLADSRSWRERKKKRKERRVGRGLCVDERTKKKKRKKTDGRREPEREKEGRSG